MKRAGIDRVGLIAFVLILPFLMVTAAAAVDVLTEEEMIGTKVEKQELMKTADNAIFLFDASEAMDAKFLDPDMSRYDIAKKVMKERNANFPDLGYNFGLYLYTPFKAIYPMQPYDRDKFGEAIGSLPAEAGGGPKELQHALGEVEKLLKDLTGKTVVFIYTDGRITEVPGTTADQMLEDLAAKYDVCFLIISTADDWASKKVVDDFADANFCSRVVTFKDFMTRPQYNTGALYIVKTFLVTGARVENILFDFDKCDLRAEFNDELDAVGKFLEKNPKTYTVIAGYTDATGSAEYNLGLAKRRAESVAGYLEANFSLASDRLVVQWFGLESPIADNSTAEGRALNRRVQVAVGREAP